LISESAASPEGDSAPYLEGAVESAQKPRHIDERYAERVGRCFAENRTQIVHWLEAKTGSLVAARDIVDEAFAALLEINHPETVHDLRAYVFKMASNLAARRGGAASLQQRIRQRIAYGLEHVDASPEPALADEQEVKRLRVALEGLPPRARLAVKLRFWDELSYAQITAEFRSRGIVINERTVKRWVASGLVYCRQQMDRFQKDGNHD
jgi:RNA polymerase sigma factor (sigma-70 family)